LLAKWLKDGRITSEELRVAGALQRYCHMHIKDVLEALFPGAKKRICGDRWKGWKRNNAASWAKVLKMRRMGLIRSHPILRPPSNRQCGGTNRQNHQRCKNWTLPGKRWCRLHGGRAVSGPNLTLAERAERRKARQAKQLARLERWHAREERKRLGLLPLTTDYKPEPPPQRTLESEFRQHPRPKPLKPLY
jgi:hypothetical protein